MLTPHAGTISLSSWIQRAERKMTMFNCFQYLPESLFPVQRTCPEMASIWNQLSHLHISVCYKIIAIRNKCNIKYSWYIVCLCRYYKLLSAFGKKYICKLSEAEILKYIVLYIPTQIYAAYYNNAQHISVWVSTQNYSSEMPFLASSIGLFGNSRTEFSAPNAESGQKFWYKTTTFYVSSIFWTRLYV
jgi:hypothetical protein